MNHDAVFPLWDGTDAHDACGVGFVADRAAEASHHLVRVGVECLHNLDHRGAKSEDGTGDGAGIMTRIPYALLDRELRAAGVRSIPRLVMGVVMTFLPHSSPHEARRLVTSALADEGITVVHWRRVPVGPMALSPTARASMPSIEQAIVVAPGDVRDTESFERHLLLARRAVAREAIEGLYVVSASSRTIVYKGLFTASNIEDFYWDLKDPAYESDFVIFHQRYSTNTSPSWELAQPFRTLAHNGEINTVQANRSWMAARSNDLRSELWDGRIGELAPLLSDSRSDSASLDEAFEVLVRSGRSLAHVKEMLIPEAWENVELDPALQAFHEYHAFLTEPWDGPAAIVASDGRHLIAGLDRNGLRPARWTITPDLVIVASEVGIAPGEEIHAVETGQLGPGEILAVDLDTGTHTFGPEVKRLLAARAPYSDWIRTQTLYVQDPFDELQDDRFDPEALARVFGYTPEERRLILGPMSEGRDPVLSMGNDTGLAALAQLRGIPQRMSRYFHQAFAQVTNPPMDPIRERLVMSLRTYLGRRGSLLEETPQQARLMELASPVLSDAEVERIRSSDDPAFHSAWLEALFDPSRGEVGMVTALDGLCERASKAVHDGAAILIVSDREVDAEHAPIPILLAVGAIHHRLIDDGLRLQASIVVVSGEPRDAHDLACLIGFGASAVNCYVAIEQVRALAAGGDLSVGIIEAQERYRSSLENGLLKIMSKMGVCTISAYRGSELFEAIGLNGEVCERAFRRVHLRVGGIGLDRIAEDAVDRHARFDTGSGEVDGYYKHRRGGVDHINAPRTVLALQRAVRSGEWSDYESYLDLVERERPAMELRDLLDFEPLGQPIALDQVESWDRIARRFTTAAMSLGALSTEAHETLAEAMNYLGGLSNSGEGGEDPDRYRTTRNSAIKQVASGRFGVTPTYLASAEELQIKMAQGSKPGEGGQLPGHKVTGYIAGLRHTEPGVTLISPPPHHDIYSIEDLAQLVYDLKTFKPHARVAVKLVSGPGVGTISVGVAKAQADVITISGNSGGTGASPLVSVKHAGSPWEIGLPEAHQALVANGLRSKVILETDGGLRTGRDLVIAAMLGADRFGFGTIALLALGCKMVRQCHENTCPVGIATQREDLRAKYTGSVEQLIRLFTMIAEDVRRWLATLGAHSLDELVGRGDLLVAADPDHPIASRFARLLVAARPRNERGFRRFKPSPLTQVLAVEGPEVAKRRSALDLSYPIHNRDRAIGTRMSGVIAEECGEPGLVEGSVRIRLFGSAGQSLGAFLAPGMALHLTGAANDCVGKGMGGGTITIVPSIEGDGQAHGAGNACLYGATGGRLFVAGTVGQRFAVRNSGATAVIEGASDHLAEYMTGGTVVVLGGIGRNAAAGMTGGRLVVWDSEKAAKSRFADTAPTARRLREDQARSIARLIEDHWRHTRSPRARYVLNRWFQLRDHFWILEPAATVEPSITIELDDSRESGTAL